MIFGVERACHRYFIIDMVFNFTMCAVDDNGFLISDRRAIAKTYLQVMRAHQM